MVQLASIWNTHPSVGNVGSALQEERSAFHFGDISVANDSHHRRVIRWVEVLWKFRSYAMLFDAEEILAQKIVMGNRRLSLIER